MPGLLFQNIEWTRVCPRDIEIRFVVSREDTADLATGGPTLSTSFSHPGGAGGTEQAAPNEQRAVVVATVENVVGDLTITVTCGTATGTTTIPITNAMPSLGMIAYVSVCTPQWVLIEVDGSVSDECPSYCRTNVTGVWVDENYVEHAMGARYSTGASFAQYWSPPPEAIACGFYGIAIDPFDAISWEAFCSVSFPKPAQRRAGQYGDNPPPPPGYP